MSYYYPNKYYNNNYNYNSQYNGNRGYQYYNNYNYYNYNNNRGFYYNNNNYNYNNNNYYYNNRNNYCYYDYKYSDFYDDSDYNDDFWEDDYLDEEEYFDMLTSEDKNVYGYMYNLPNINQRIVIIDTEVSGINEKNNILEICALEMINGRLTGEKFHSFFKPKNHMSNFLNKKHKIPKKAFFYTREQEFNIFWELLCFIKDSLIITYNASHDLEVINKGLNYYNLDQIDQFKFRCCMRIFYEKYNLKPTKFLKLKECVEYFKIKYKKCYLHLVSYDAFLVGKILEKIYEDELGNNKSVGMNNNCMNINN